LLSSLLPHQILYWVIEKLLILLCWLNLHEESYHLPPGRFWLPSAAFIYFSCLTGLTKTFSSICNKSRESEHPCFVTEFRENAFSFSPLSMMLAMDLSYDGYMIFYPSFSLCEYQYIYWFAYAQPSLHAWGKTHLIMVNDLFDMLLNLTC
jgi:hypothetical protein